MINIPTVTNDVSMANYTSFGCGGNAEALVEVTSHAQLLYVLQSFGGISTTVMGGGTNSLVSDKGIEGLVIAMRTKRCQLLADGFVEVEAGVPWDTLVRFAVNNKLWGLELMSGIPGSVGGGILGNIAAYGQAVSDTLRSVELYDLSTNSLTTVSASDLGLVYRASRLQGSNKVLLKAVFKLSGTCNSALSYESALKIAEEIKADVGTLTGRRNLILEARRRVGSLQDGSSKSAGSFFKNPLISPEQARILMAQDETGKSVQQLEHMNTIHGGAASRVSAAHVMLAAGFYRGQQWGPVRLHPDHVLKIDNTGGATAKQIFDVANIVVVQVKNKLGITLVPEVRFLGDFS
jgi:UDP-N-acetylmuramate dehydrogenase